HGTSPSRNTLPSHPSPTPAAAIKRPTPGVIARTHSDSPQTAATTAGSTTPYLSNSASMRNPNQENHRATETQRIHKESSILRALSVSSRLFGSYFFFPYFAALTASVTFTSLLIIPLP